MSKRAIILAGGKGTRLRPYTIVFPKPLMPIGDYPILEVIIRQLKKYKFDHITLAVNHQANLIKAFFGDGSKWGIKIDYSLEENSLGTMGPLKLISNLPDNFLVMNGDILTDLNYSDFYIEHEIKKELFTISSYQRKHQIDYGVLKVNDKKVLSGFSEKPITTYQVSMGIYMVSNKILNYIPKDIPYGFDNLMNDLLNDSKSVQVNEHNGYWLDIGRPDDYMQAIEEFNNLKSTFLDE
jgi:NDP-sugar pyrophosphorylase family protein